LRRNLLSTTNVERLYDKSHALIIGINEYAFAPPLRYAVSDAKAIADTLKTRFNFADDSIHLLLDEQATRSAILEKFMNLTSAGTTVNDRVIFFFAGHGHTVPSKRGQVGYLIPQDGKADSLVSLIRWDELTRNADLIEAKHLFFLMDACYSGLAIMRALDPGSSRFLKDMLMRPARQVLTAGKANEQVVDTGGPLPNHSVFTGHLLEALEGKASDSRGLITANGVMAYVYQMVAHDRDSRQTPHFGYLDGDGDFIFLAPKLSALQKEEERDEDILVSIPAVLTTHQTNETMTIIRQTKELLSDEKFKIALHDLVTEKIREVMSLTAEDNFPVSDRWSEDKFIQRLKRYEEATEDLGNIQALLSYWGTEAHRDVLSLPLRRLCGRLGLISGNVGWIAQRWYPALLLMYMGGIASIAAGKYENLKVLFTTPIIDPENASEELTSILAVVRSLDDLRDAFKLLPGHARHRVPRSEYLFKLLQPTLDDMFFFGTDYEACFDRFEVLLALEHAHQLQRIWGPVGRFGWKYKARGTASPFHRVLEEGISQGANWGPVKAGLFGGSFERFNEVAREYEKDILAKLRWY
jgi:uncharacterized caspase-like protein